MRVMSGQCGFEAPPYFGGGSFESGLCNGVGGYEAERLACLDHRLHSGKRLQFCAPSRGGVSSGSAP